MNLSSNLLRRPPLLDDLGSLDGDVRVPKHGLKFAVLVKSLEFSEASDGGPAENDVEVGVGCEESVQEGSDG